MKVKKASYKKESPTTEKTKSEELVSKEIVKSRTEMAISTWMEERINWQREKRIEKRIRQGFKVWTRRKTFARVEEDEGDRRKTNKRKNTAGDTQAEFLTTLRNEYVSSLLPRRNKNAALLRRTLVAWRTGALYIWSVNYIFRESLPRCSVYAVAGGMISRWYHPVRNISSTAQS